MSSKLKNQMKMVEIRFFPIYGLAAGINYWDSYMDFDAEEVQEEGESVHMIQLLVFLGGMSLIWYKKA